MRKLFRSAFLVGLLCCCTALKASETDGGTLPYLEAKQIDFRLCGEPTRDTNGDIVRSKKELALYKRIHPCPVTGKATGACSGWAVDHVIPLASGGCDSVVNMAWMPVQIKSCARDECKDRWERTYYGKPLGTHGVVKAIQ